MEGTVHGFKTLPLKYSEKSTCYHQLFIKENSAKSYSEDKPIGKTLFVINIPPYISEKTLLKLFSEAGKIEKVFLQVNTSLKETANCHKPRNGFKLAYIVFHDYSGLTNALKLKKLPSISKKQPPNSLGLKKWISDYNKNVLIDEEQMEKKITRFMNKYDKESEKQKKEDTNIVEDEEGWIKVTKSGRNPGVSRKSSGVNKINGRKKKELKNFYTFQIRESKMKNLAELRKKYEEDKKKIAAMKEKRKFKPFIT